MAELVWYAAYGSNLLAARCLTYLTGGLAPFRPANRPHPGAGDPSEPLDDRRWPLRHPLFFAGTSKGWGDRAVAMLDQQHTSDEPTLGRIWLVTRDQFEDVVRQENGRPVPGRSLPYEPATGPLFTLDDLAPGHHLDVFDGWYGRVLHLGSGPRGFPVLTFVGADPGRPERGPAHPAYLRTLGLGLIESWGLSENEAAEYLVSRDGNSGAVTATELATDLARWSDRPPTDPDPPRSRSEP